MQPPRRRAHGISPATKALRPIVQGQIKVRALPGVFYREKQDVYLCVSQHPRGTVLIPPAEQLSKHRDAESPL